jgi:hypothetical protein
VPRARVLSGELRSHRPGFAGTRIVAIEGLGATADLDDDLEDTARRATIMRALERVESEPSILGASPHLMAIATKG